jgi:hypothetical protein
MENETVRSNERRTEGGMGVRPVFATLLLSLTSLSISCASSAKSEAFLPGRSVGKIESESLREISGLAASRRSPGVLYVHGDSGDGPRVYALDEKSHLLGVCNIRGASNRDWEDIAAGPGPDPNQQYLYIGDIGDNAGKYREIVVYRVPEPQVEAIRPFGQMTLGPAEAIRLTYPDGPRDAETLLVDPLTRDLYIISKRDLTPKVYRAAYPQATKQSAQLEQVALLPLGSFPTGGDVSPNGRQVIIRGMFHATSWERPAHEPLWKAFSGKAIALPVASEPQGEAIGFDRQGQGYFTISEGRHAALYYFAPAEPNVP